MTRAEIARKLLEAQEREFLLRDHLKAAIVRAEQCKFELVQIDLKKAGLIQDLIQAET